MALNKAPAHFKICLIGRLLCEGSLRENISVAFLLLDGLPEGDEP